MRSTLVVLGLSAVLASGLAAQNTPPTATTTNMQIAREKLRADKKLLVAENMQLTDAESAKFWPVYEAYQADQAALNDRTAKVIQDFAASYQSMTDPVADRLLTDMLKIERDRVELQDKYRPKFAAAVPATKVARYYQIERKVQSIINYELADKIPLIK
jgi:1-aminocyclopropane-1-carboxylate deaminase/D-cysteine desulfhydrase-like pyridoxal-dependent ACC family enzyme